MATRLTEYKKGAMSGPKLPPKLAHEQREAQHRDDIKKGKALEIPPATLKAAKAAASLPPGVIANAIRTAKRRFQLYHPKVNTRHYDSKRWQEEIGKWLASRPPHPSTKDDWIVIADDCWPHRHPYRLSMAIVLARKHVMRSERALSWRHALDGDWRIWPTPLKEINGLPTLTYAPEPPAKEIPENPGIKKVTAIKTTPAPPPSKEEIMSEPDDEYRRFLQIVHLPVEEWQLSNTQDAEQAASDDDEPLALDADGLIDPLALLLTPAQEHENEAEN